MRVIEVFADVTCPFTHVGLRRFVDRRAELGRHDVVLRVRSWPLEVVNGSPLDAAFIAEEVDDLRAQVAPELFAGFAEATFPATSVPALALAAAANDVDLSTGEQVSLALRTMLFEEGADIADEAVLRTVAVDHGVDWDDVDASRVLADHAEGVERHVIGSPHFFTPDADFFCPGLAISRGEDGHLQVEPKAEVFDAFLASCFA
ncbi:MAG: DsbA family protein [Actinobacteria bacterium]|nr:DsbA family protein [Actinomycetota bacterium]